MKKRILSVLLVLAMALSLVPMGVFAVPGDEGEGGDKVTVTFKIENGTWKDDKIEDKVVKVNKGDKIPDNQLKELEGAKPNTGYGNGSWDKEIPTKDDAIDASATYTYTFSDIRPAAPSGLEPVSPTIKDGNDGKITGTTNKMEYSTTEKFASKKDCTATETTGLTAGPYYVRVKEAGETPAGEYETVIVPPSTVLVANISILEGTGCKKEYKVGEKLDVTGLSIKAFLDNDTEQLIPLAKEMVTGFDTDAPKSNQRLTVTYGGKTANFTINVIKADGPAAPTGLWGVDPTTAGGSDGKIKGITEDMEYSANTNFNPAQRCSGTEIKNLQPGTYYVRVAGTDTKEPSEATTVVVPTFGNGVTKIEVNSTNHKTAYLVGDELDVTGLTILVTKSNNSTETVDVTADMVTGFNSSAAAQNKVLTVTYWGEKTTYKINITVPTKATVTFKVVNGTWSDGTTADQVVTIDLTNGKGKLDASKVPTGMKPNVGYKNIGTWDTVPDTDSDKVTRDVTYTCTFTKKENVAVVTFKVVNGKWKDNTTAPKQEEITLTNGKGTLDTSKVPTEMKANEGYENGAWDTAPVTTENGITEDVTYTYTFAAKETVAVVTFQIVNGTWSDKKTDPITKEITLVNGKGTLSAADVPTGMIANEGYGEGSWNTDLSKGAEITGNVTYTYGYNLLKATVTFKVVNGTWKDGSIKDITVTVDLKDGKGTLVEKQIPTGMIGNPGCSIVGQWDKYPDTTAGGITKDITYTYSFAGGDPCQSFTDVDRSAWYHNAVDYVLENSLMNGTGDNKFDPNGGLSRAMLCQILYNKEGKPVFTKSTTFPDVPNGEWYTDAVYWAAFKGIVTGYETGKFGPNDGITREQLAAMIYRYEKIVKGSGFSGDWAFDLNFPDAAKVSTWSSEAVKWCVMKGVINGKEVNKIKYLDPQGGATRAEVAQMIMNYMKL